MEDNYINKLPRMQHPTAAERAASRRVVKYKKAPGAPKRFKSAFIFYSIEKHKEIRESLGDRANSEKTTNVAKIVAEEWRKLSGEERHEWEEKARLDKERYEREKKEYSGPWKVATTKKAPRDPSAPKRPMSAFLAFSNGKRAEIKRQNPTMEMGEISRLLSTMWHELPEDQRDVYLDEEYALRQEYKASMKKWKKKNEQERAAEAFLESRRKDSQAQSMAAASSAYAAAAVASMPPQQRDGIQPDYGDMYQRGWMPSSGEMSMQHQYPGSLQQSSYLPQVDTSAYAYMRPPQSYYAGNPYDQDAGTYNYPGSSMSSYPGYASQYQDEQAALYMSQLAGMQQHQQSMMQQQPPPGAYAQYYGSSNETEWPPHYYDASRDPERR